MVSVIDKIAAEHENIIKVLDEIRKASKREEMEMVVLVGIGATPLLNGFLRFSGSEI